jgi:hypothetical protein
MRIENAMKRKERLEMAVEVAAERALNFEWARDKS